MFETIVALATPPIKSALAIIRVSGKDSLDIISKCCKKDLTGLQERKIVYTKIYNGDCVVDEVILNVYIAPKTYTGENLVEIMCHGSLLIANEIIELLIANGARLATGGEFTSRAFMNEKMDLIQAEAVNDVINATTKEAKQLSIMSLHGETSQLLEPIKKQIADLMSQIEVNIDYPEYEDIEEVTNAKVIEVVDVLHEQIQKLIDEGKQGNIIKDGIKVAIVGKPNVGKSSLLNALLNEDKAIVTAIPGTTRDVVEGDVNLNGLVLHLLDTAGIRESEDTVEAIGMEKTKKIIKEADLVLLVIDATSGITLEDQVLIGLTNSSRRIVVYNKADLSDEAEKSQGDIYISAQNKDIDDLKKEIIAEFQVSDEAYSRPSLNNARQIGLLMTVDNSLLKAQSDAQAGETIDLVEVSIQHAYQSVLNLLGESSGNDLTKEIFSRFCVGK